MVFPWTPHLFMSSFCFRQRRFVHSEKRHTLSPPITRTLIRRVKEIYLPKSIALFVCFHCLWCIFFFFCFYSFVLFSFNLSSLWTFPFLLDLLCLLFWHSKHTLFITTSVSPEFSIAFLFFFFFSTSPLVLFDVLSLYLYLTLCLWTQQPHLWHSTRWLSLVLDGCSVCSEEEAEKKKKDTQEDLLWAEREEREKEKNEERKNKEGQEGGERKRENKAFRTLTRGHQRCFCSHSQNLQKGTECGER